MEGVDVRPKERERRLAKQRVDRSHRGVVARQRRRPLWTMGEKALLVLSLALLVASMVLTAVMLLLA